MLKELPDKQFFDLILTSEDRLGMDYIEESQRRKDQIIPFLCKVLSDEKKYQIESEGSWGFIHAVYILGILGDFRGFNGLLSASRVANVYGIDWIWEVLPECYLRMGKVAIPALMEHVEKEKTSESEVISSEISGLWNLWNAYPEERDKIEAFLVGILKDPGIDPATRADLIGDFAQINRRDLKPLFEEYYERGEVDLDTLTREDLDDFFDNVNDPPGHRQDLEEFYSAESIAERQGRWEKENEEMEQHRMEKFILENFKRISRNDPCPCGSGKKFKKCHLQWAETKLLHQQTEKELAQENRPYGDPISIERKMESALRRFLAKKDKTNIFSEIKGNALELIKVPQSELSKKGFDHYFAPIISKIGFDTKGEFEEFMSILVEYYNSLAAQFPADYPRGGGSFH